MHQDVPERLSLKASTEQDQALRQPSLLGDRFREFSNSSPVIGFFKLFLDPFLAVATLYALTIPFAIAHDGVLVLMAVLTFLLTAVMLDGVFLFVPGYSRPLLGLGRFAIEWFAVLVTLYLIGMVSGFNAYIHPPYFVAWAISAPLVLVSTHLLFRLFVLHPGKQDIKNVVIIGANTPGQALAKNIQTYSYLKMNFLGFFEDRESSRLGDINKKEIIGDLTAFPEFVSRHNVQQIYITLPMTAQPRVMAILDCLKDSTASVYFVPDLFVFDLINARFDHVAGLPVVAICESPFLGLSGVVKRISDIVLSLMILALIWPVLLAVSIAVKLTSPGPIFFKQKRYGEDGQSVLVYKFRSMTVMENGDKVIQATKNDVRLTPIGGFIRKTSLDELPQFINVLEGKMSIVGPRPHANAHNEQYRKLIKGYMIRHMVKPGITGWAQVNGFRGETDTLDKMEGRIAYDLDYLRNWSVWLDIKIIWMTATSMFRDKNAF
ncbi:undecaprenyl-phosphate glucose phosphotransferase [Deefgea tanakiae]|uniref:Undecaprenyl-phosphate glucose phosphotransferase n=1 Tax=Deefgea tanakiae TaxID=2865840 RepID=A0ABX8ZAM9_9NEIS|nr:undecaprenyl-phosphate glucose phosphotransferase [Deefgea tanakiae]QZA78225.1 undecaprenyl-phosphate glucose phosphotransferase [Deefgea tanakiae]